MKLVLQGDEGVITFLGECDTAQHSCRDVGTDLGGLEGSISICATQYTAPRSVYLFLHDDLVDLAVRGSDDRVIRYRGLAGEDIEH